MLWPLKLGFKLVTRLKVIIVSVLAGMVIAFLLQLREQQQTWGIVARDVSKTLAGDDIIEDADIVETRTIVVEAAPSTVWPWLVQMGYGRAGWYSYDRLDIEGSSAVAVLPQFQDLAAGDLVPTHPGGGFVARVVDPEKALVLYLDSDLVRSQVEATVADGDPTATDEHSPAGLHLAGALGGMSMPEFRATWTFILEPETDGTRTRLIERFRVKAADEGIAQKLSLPLMGIGVFAMTRKHMLGLKERAESMAGRGSGNGVRAPKAEPAEA
jgi:hypothetical protein